MITCFSPWILSYEVSVKKQQIQYIETGCNKSEYHHITGMKPSIGGKSSNKTGMGDTLLIQVECITITDLSQQPPLTCLPTGSCEEQVAALKAKIAAKKELLMILGCSH